MSPPRGVKRKAGSLPPSSPVKRIAMSEQSGDEDMDADGEENEDDEQDQDQEDHQDNGEEVPRKDNEDEDDDLLGLLVQQSARAPPSTSVYTEEPAPKLQNQNGSHHSASPQLPLPKPRRTAEEEIQFRIAVLPHLVTALALSVTTTTPLSHILPEVLEQSSLASYDHEDITEMCRTLLEDGVKGMFGKVVRRGKDASGRPLENVYFYNADKDPDRERGRNLGNLGGRRVRHAQMTDKQYYWRPVGRKRT
ncbi:hypothetical protein DACRYDRAFT_20872 [Dacryopinax primogenitus]|uniref:Uncharacterized protein n=1 Tax=Dacryopinax primogenitus (strain DJM 731) TaxID=1858805 RepID=M5G275_DACPD|nr:uncharacterized protein DACRYDRAFT_20872 [Dacryopinax primogenitus]EJU04301.1 hypothetical protein DACRYDRAFT_20872 [Dacryopinax primogenitus]